MQTAVRKPYKLGNLTTFDRVAVDGREVRVFRRKNSVQKLIRGTKQLTALYKLGTRPDVILIQVR